VRQIDEGRIFVGCEGEELSIAEAVRITGNKPYVFSTDYPHEVDAQTCKPELEELRENRQLSPADKDAILFGNSQRFYQLALS
jgi:predicted TIM-barrel fold metal-dependent hydrolase